MKTRYFRQRAGYCSIATTLRPCLGSERCASCGLRSEKNAVQVMEFQHYHFSHTPLLIILGAMAISGCFYWPSPIAVDHVGYRNCTAMAWAGWKRGRGRVRSAGLGRRSEKRVEPALRRQGDHSAHPPAALLGYRALMAGGRGRGVKGLRGRAVQGARDQGRSPLGGGEARAPAKEVWSRSDMKASR